MASKTICDACGHDMTDEPARLAFDLDLPRVVDADGNGWPLIPLCVITAAHKRFDAGGSVKADVCLAVDQGTARDLGPVTR